MKLLGSFCKVKLCLLVLVAICAAPRLMRAEAMSVLGGTLSWSTSSAYEPCGNGQFQIMNYTSFSWQFGNTVYPVSGSVAYIYSSPGGQCPAEGPQGKIGYTVPSSVGFSSNCAFLFTPTGPPGEGTIATQSCSGFQPAPPSKTVYPDLQWAGLSGDPNPPPSGATWEKREGAETGSSTAPPYSCDATGSGGATVGNVISGSSSDGALEMTDTNTSSSACPEWNELGVLDVDFNPSPDFLSPPTVNLEVDMKFYLPSGTTYQALEFDPDLTLENSGTDDYTYQPSVECDFDPGTGTPIWKYFDSNVQLWKSFTVIGASNDYSCSDLTAGWHQLQLYVTMDTNGHTYHLNYA